jgi:hypothetical protein
MHWFLTVEPLAGLNVKCLDATPIPPDIFRDTLTKLVNAAKLPYSELTKAA